MGRLVEWVEKAFFFFRLNKLFVIFAFERDHQVLLSNKNLQALVKKAKPFILPILPRLTPRSLVPDEHYMLKDLSFYEVARLTDSKACQTCLEQRKKKCQNGTLMQTLTINHPVFNYTVQPSVKKKKRLVIRISLFSFFFIFLSIFIFFNFHHQAENRG